jgi:DNA-binding NarL/FixJ family response regulator
MTTIVLVASDLRLVRDWLAHDVGSAPDLAVAGTAPDRTTALALARRLSPDVLLLDRGMPDGLLAVLEITAERPRLRVLAYGVQETEPEVAVCSDAGVHGFIPRDAGRDGLIESLRRTMRGEFVGSPAVSALVLRHFVHRTEPVAGHGLTGRELEIMRLLELGRSNKEIGAALGIEVATVKHHVHNLLHKLQARRRSEATAKWRSCGRAGITTWVARRSG